MRVLEVATVYDPGCHCAFTDIIRWNDRLYLCFREALNHGIGLSGQIVVLCSADNGQSFQTHGRIAEPHVDLRDPHFFTVEDRLCITIPSWVVTCRAGEKPEHTRASFAAQSRDGVKWELYEIPGLRGRTLWRPRLGPDGLWYAGAYAHEEPSGRAVWLVRSRDGRQWEEVSLIHGEGRPNETELCFLEDGGLVALVRREDPPGSPILARAAAPYVQWSKVEASRFLKGPLMERLPDGSFVAVGRSPEPLENPSGGKYRTRMFSLDIEAGGLDLIETLPSGGDTSYAGLCLLPDGGALLSYYSGHLYANGSYRSGQEPQRCGIYLARLAL